MPKLSTGLKIVIGLVIALIVIAAVLVILYFINHKPSPEPEPTDTITAEIAPPAVNYDGIYKGNTAVASGLANVTFYVSGTTLTGDAIYNGEQEGYTLTLPAVIEGTVSSTGAITGTVIVSGSQYGMDFYFSGTTDGNITDNTAHCTYSVSGEEGTYGGDITLTKV